jgi:hypothetical protein
MLNTGARHHLVIAGIGRAGTSFLVRYLDAMGLDTHIGRQESPRWDENAYAGLEDSLSGPGISDLPYACKSPWLYQVIDQVLADDRIKLDGVILPMRDIMEAAASRSILELRARYQASSWMAEQEQAWDDWCHVPGGAVFSLHPLDQARILAHGFYRLLERLMREEIPVAFLHFPRFVEDADYLFQQLRPFLPPTTTLADARTAHLRLADSQKVRVDKELAGQVSGTARPGEDGEPGFDTVNYAAALRELRRVQAENDSLHRSEREIAESRARSEREIAELREANAALRQAQARLQHRLDQRWHKRLGRGLARLR